jgi:hypothetical protein
MRKILLNKSRSKESVNESMTIPITINRDVSLIQNDIFDETIDIMELYNNEKDSCSKHRFIFTLHPICSNVLFNKLTEVVYDEYSDKASMLTNSNYMKTPQTTVSKQTNPNRLHVIRNTEYSIPKYNLTYHCGADIFNNHLLRSKEGITVQKRNPYSKKECKVYIGDSERTYSIDPFNTIGDYSRTYYGIDVKCFGLTDNYTFSNSAKKLSMPLYTYDTISSFMDSYKDGIKRKDGWIGFYNQSSMRISVKNDEDYFVNKCLNNVEACNFIEMCPEKELFMFTPLKNKKRNRIENNWDCYLTYPYLSVYNDGSFLKGKGNGLPLSLFDDNKIYYEYGSNSGIPLLMFRTCVKHNLRTNDTINIITIDDNSNITKNRCKVFSLGDLYGDNDDRYFTIRSSDIEEYRSVLNNNTRFSKVVYGIECEYYFRKLKKIKINEKIPKPTFNKLAFSNTAYGDEVTQVLFTDDINIDGYVNNRGVPLTEIFLTIVKNNKGHDLWYDKNIYNSSEIEASRVFGKVTSGMDLPIYSGFDVPNIRLQHNISVDGLIQSGDTYYFSDNKTNINKSSVKLESDIKNSMDDFYCDLVEFNPISLVETTIEDIYHRFNTGQRETRNSNYGTLYYDEIEGDIFDSGNIVKSEPTDIVKIREHHLNSGFANISPEGYIYKPNHKITIGKLDDNVKQEYGDFIEISTSNDIMDITLRNNGNTITFKTNKNYSLYSGCLILLSKNVTKEVYKYNITDTTFNDAEKKYVTTIKNSDNSINLSQSDLQKITLFKCGDLTPSYIYAIPDGSGRYMWRDIVKPSEYNYMDELYNLTFTNGSLYHHKNITLPVKRQDPFGKYGMFVKDEYGEKNDNKFEVPSKEADYSADELYDKNDKPVCF